MRMSDSEKITYIVILAVFLICFLSMMLTGCSVFKVHEAIPQPPIELTPGQQVSKIVQSTNWLATLSIIGVGAGFFSFLNGGTRGIQIMAACFVVLSLVLGVAKYSSWIAFLAVAGAVILLGYTILVKTKAIKEIVAGVQDMKQVWAPNNGACAPRSKRDINDALSNAQSKSTQELVQNVKNNK